MSSGILQVKGLLTHVGQREENTTVGHISFSVCLTLGGLHIRQAIDDDREAQWLS